MRLLSFLLVLGILLGCRSPQEQEESQPWIPLFNGVDLTGWIPKFSDHPLGENYKNTFRVQDSVIHVSYAEYDTFRNEFGHLFYDTPFSFYRLQLEYRFFGEPTPGAPNWAIRNNGVMIIAQSPQSMLLDQDFPLSVEVQFLGGDGTNERSTGNLCTPGLHVYINDTIRTEHCIPSDSKTYHGDQWVSIEVAVLPDSTIHHIVAGDTVMSYARPVVGGEYLPEGYPIRPGRHVIEGYIALQAESHSIEFRNIRLQEIR